MNFSHKYGLLRHFPAKWANPVLGGRMGGLSKIVLRIGILFFAFFLPFGGRIGWGFALHAQTPLPVIKATSKRVAINDGGFLDKDAWSLSPAARPDVYTADRTRQTKQVTFYTDIDSITVKLKPGMRYNFIILLNGKDSCYTQIASAIPPDDATTAKTETHDTIPFTLSPFSAIQVKAIANDTATLNLHFDASSFMFRLTKDAIAATHLTHITKLQMGSMVWHNPDVSTTGFTSQGMDGRFGWNLFEGKAVEINYDNNIIVIHSTLPKTLKGYVSARLEFIRSFPVVTGAFTIHGKKYKGRFLLDTGADLPIILDSSWAAAVHFPSDLPVIKTQVLKDPRGAQYTTRTVVAPQFTVNGFVVANLSTLILGSNNPVGFSVNYLGNGLLKRFNMVLDFKHDRIWLKKNRLMGVETS